MLIRQLLDVDASLLFLVLNWHHCCNKCSSWSFNQSSDGIFPSQRHLSTVWFNNQHVLRSNEGRLQQLTLVYRHKAAVKSGSLFITRHKRAWWHVGGMSGGSGTAIFRLPLTPFWRLILYFLLSHGEQMKIVSSQSTVFPQKCPVHLLVLLETNKNKLHFKSIHLSLLPSLQAGSSADRQHVQMIGWVY